MHDEQQSQNEYQRSGQPTNDGLHGGDAARVFLPILIFANPKEAPEYGGGDLQRASLASWRFSGWVLWLF